MGDRVIPIKIERIALGGGQDNTRYTPANINEDYLAMRGIYLQKTSGADSVVGIDRETNSNVMWLFANGKSFTLDRLSVGYAWEKEVFTGYTYGAIQLSNYSCSNTGMALFILNGLVLEEGTDYTWDSQSNTNATLGFTMSTSDRLVVRYPHD